MDITLNNTVGEIVKSNFQTARLFHEKNIDYCCGGRKTLSDACKEAGVEPDQLIRELELLTMFQDPDSDYINTMRTDQLTDYIIHRHHSYVRKMIPFILTNLNKICLKHGENHPEVFVIRELFEKAVGNLAMHMQKEELMLFPFIRKMVAALDKNAGLPSSVFGSVMNPIHSMTREHADEGGRLDEISRLSDHYTAPADACTTYRNTWESLKEFETDLHRHIHLENNILFPKAEELEAKLKNI